VEAVRRLVGFRQIGHLGTLDPLATGVLVLALGRATRLARFYASRRKRYELARKHKPVHLDPVEVEIYDLRLASVEGPLARFAIECGAGTYIRSLAQDLGALQGSGAHLAQIARTAVGEFT